MATSLIYAHILLIIIILQLFSSSLNCNWCSDSAQIFAGGRRRCSRSVPEEPGFGCQRLSLPRHTWQKECPQGRTRSAEHSEQMVQSPPPKRGLVAPRTKGALQFGHGTSSSLDRRLFSLLPDSELELEPSVSDNSDQTLGQGWRQCAHTRSPCFFSLAELLSSFAAGP